MLLRTALLVFATLAVPAAAGAVTLRDLIELSKAGLPDEVLVAVIDADRTIFTLEASQILELKKAGVSKAVLLKMLRSRQEFEAKAPEIETTSVVAAPATSPGRATPAAVASSEVLIIGTEPPRAYDTNAPRYYYVPYLLWGVPHGRRDSSPPPPFLAPEHRGFGRFINDGWIGKP